MAMAAGRTSREASTSGSTRASLRGRQRLSLLPPSMRVRHTSLVLASLLVGYVTFVNAWCGDDPYITLRTVDNAIKGYGLTWNPYERVQVFTDPLWALLLTG